MPRPPRRNVPTRQDVTTTPTRPQNNVITAAIPPFMLETPPHAPFVTTPGLPSANPGDSIVPGGRSRHARAQTHQTPLVNGDAQEQALEQSQNAALVSGSTASETGRDEELFLDSIHNAVEDAKWLQGLRDISSLATWTLSSAKPGCALPQLRHPGPSQFWQSDGPQPHTLTLHFFKLVAIIKMRIYLDFELDESYTPTKMKFFAGMSEGGLVEFGSWEAVDTTDPETGETHSSVEAIRGWLEIPLQGVGGRESHQFEEYNRLSENGGDVVMDGAEDEDDLIGGDVLKAMVVQIQICENHQNGKDTHVRGFQVFARDEAGAKEMRKVVKKSKAGLDAVESDLLDETEVLGLHPASWMGDPEIR